MIEEMQLPEQGPASVFKTPASSDDELRAKVKITDTDKENFFKSFLTDQPYEESFPLFGGKATVTFRSISLAENEDIYKQIRADQDNGASRSDNAYLAKIMTYNLSVSLLKVDGKEVPYTVTKQDYKKPEGTDNTYIAARAEVFNSWSQPKFTAILEAFRQFTFKITELTKEISNPNF